MTIRNILHVKKDDREFFVIAEPFWAKRTMKHFNSKTKRFMDFDDVKFKLVELKHGKPQSTLGFVSNLKPGSQIIKIKAKTICEEPKVVEYVENNIYIIDIVYSF